MRKNTESLKVESLASLPQSSNDFGTQWTRVTIRSLPTFWARASTSMLHKVEDIQIKLFCLLHGKQLRSKNQYKIEDPSPDIRGRIVKSTNHVHLHLDMQVN